LRKVATELPAPTLRDWVKGKPQTGPNIKRTEDTELANRLRLAGYAEFLQAPKRGKQPASGRPCYILKIYPDQNAPAAAAAPRPANTRYGTVNPKKSGLLPWYVLVPLAEAGISESKKQRSTIAKSLKEEKLELKRRLAMTDDDFEEQRLLDAIQTNKAKTQNIEQEILNRVARALSQSDEPYSGYVDLVDWTLKN
jgi:hypothetical protein